MDILPTDLAFRKVLTLARTCGYFIEYRPIKYVKGWPQKSTRPYLLQYDDGSHLASFASLTKLERNLRARAGC